MVSVFFFFYVGLLHQSHSPRQFACLSESEKGGLSALTPHRGCAMYPNRPLLAFKSRASFLFYLALVPVTIAPTLLCLSTQQLRSEEKKAVVERERESLGYYLMRSRSARLLFTVTKQTGATLQEPLSLVFLLFLGSCGCRLHLNNHHFMETVSALTRCFFLSRYIPPQQQKVHQNSMALKVISTSTASYIIKSPNHFISANCVLSVACL